MIRRITRLSLGVALLAAALLPAPVAPAADEELDRRTRHLEYGHELERRDRAGEQATTVNLVFNDGMAHTVTYDVAAPVARIAEHRPDWRRRRRPRSRCPTITA